MDVLDFLNVQEVEVNKSDHLKIKRTNKAGFE